jgi:predicted phage terminase large subunit-like protein
MNLPLSQVSPKKAATELLIRRKARASVLDYVNAIDVPGKPATDDPDEEFFLPIETTVAHHHRLILEAFDRTSQTPHGRLMVFLPPGSAKALALDTPIPTHNGWKLMGELRVGDKVFDETGKSCSVTWVSPVWRDRPVYRVITDCGDEIIADRDHEWLVRLSGKPRKPLKGNGVGRPGMPNRDNPASRFKIKETWDLCRTRAKRPMIPRADSLELPDAILPIDPYLLGVWLGDGSKQSVRITSSVEDQPWLRAEIERLGHETRDTTVPTLFQVIGVRSSFAAMGLLDDKYHNTHGRKHIPPAYLRASKAQRLALLQGLIDTDGTVCKSRGCTTFCNIDKELAESVRELVRSLGVKAGWSEGRAVLNGIDHGSAYRVSFYLEGSARIPRKASLTRNQERTPNTYIDVLPAGYADTVCIEVDSPSHLFLCGRSMTPTHNSTYGSVVFPSRFLGQAPGRKLILASYGDDLARKMGRRTRQICRSPRYRGIWGYELSKESSAAEQWALTNGSEYMACGLMSGITGNRANGAIIDDPVRGREQANSETIRQKTWDAYQDDLLTRLIPGGWLAIIQTRWHENDLAGRILPMDWKGESGMIECRDGNTWEVLCVQAKAEAGRNDPLGRQPGEYLWPEWFDRKHWAQFETNARTWASLFQQMPTPAEGDLFKPDMISVVGAVPTGAEFVRGWDLAGSAGGGDYTAGPKLGRCPDGRWIIADMVRFQGGPEEVEAALKNTADRDGYETRISLPQDPGQAGKGQAANFVKMLAGYMVETSPETGSKETRAAPFAAQVNVGNVMMLKAPWNDALIAELRAFPNGTFDDQVDGLSRAFNTLNAGEGLGVWANL